MINSIPHLLAAPVSGHRSGSCVFVHALFRRLTCGCSLDRVEVESSLWLWVELLCMEAVVDQEDTSHNHSRTEVEDLRRVRQSWT